MKINFEFIKKQLLKNINKKMECRQKQNKAGCPCTYEPCPRKGICCECLKYHLSRNELPACCFSKEAEATYDRSFENFIKDKKQNGRFRRG